MELNIGCGYDSWGDVRLDITREYLGKKTKANIIADAQNLPFRNSCFDTVKASHILEHLPNWCQALKEWMNVIKGKLIIVVPVGDGFKRYVVCAIPRLNLSQLKIFALSRKVHLWQINPRIVKEFITSHGFECKIQTYRRSVFPFPFLAIFMIKLEYKMVALRMN